MHTLIKSSLGTTVLYLFLLSGTIFADTSTTKKLSYLDKDDKHLDLSEFMSKAYGFIPVPIIITEPSVGYGGGLAIIYLHDNIVGKKSQSGRRIPPSISGIMAAKTENGTTVGGAFHIGYWQEDTIRTATYIGKPDVFINLYSQDKIYEMNLNGLFAYQSVKFRVKESNLFLGLSYMYTQTNLKFDLPNFEKDFLGDSNVASIGAIVEYDSRDNQMSPNSGMLLNAKALLYDENVGSDYNLIRYKLNATFYNKLTHKTNLDFKLNAENITGDKIPVYLYPFVSMRGVPMMKYQGSNLLSAQVQFSYDFTQRYRGVAFGGAAKAFAKQIGSPDISFSNAKNIYTKGIGFRYLIAKKFGLRVGLDIAKSNEDKAFYIQFGTAWKGL